jgi:hypothetical protein
MPKAKGFSEEGILNILKVLPESKKIEALDFLGYLSQRFKKVKRQDVKRAVMAVEDTWGSIKLDKKTLRYIAEDKEIEYDV